MKAIQIHAFGGPEVLQMKDVPAPEINDDEVLVRVHASGVNPVDWKIREGYMKHNLPFIPGWDLSGTIEEVGGDVENFRPGDAVYGRPDVKRNGTYAEMISVKAKELAGKPANITHIEAAAIPLAGLTAWQCLFEHGNLQKGQRILIHAASGGVGSYAVQFAKWKGAYIIGTASPENHEFLRELGADECVDYHEKGFEQHITDLDMVLDLVGGETQKRSLGMLRKGGILVTTVGVEDEASFLGSGIRITGMFTSSKPEDLNAIADLVKEGSIRPIIAQVFPLQQAKLAQEKSAEGHVRGKVVLRVNDEDENMEQKKENDQNILGHQQSDFAGTNPDRYGPPAPEKDQDNPVETNEAQNMKDDIDTLSKEESEKARNKAEEGIRQGRNRE